MVGKCVTRPLNASSDHSMRHPTTQCVTRSLNTFCMSHTLGIAPPALCLMRMRIEVCTRVSRSATPAYTQAASQGVYRNSGVRGSDEKIHPRTCCAVVQGTKVRLEVDFKM